VIALQSETVECASVCRIYEQLKRFNMAKVMYFPLTDKGVSTADCFKFLSVIWAVICLHSAVFMTFIVGTVRGDYSIPSGGNYSIP
jgi:hypothetical protein